jgi:hypothetical protein
MDDQLIEAVRDRNLILFVGAGVSRALGLPSYEGLVDALAAELEYDPDIFRTLGDHLVLAEYYVAEKGSLGDLRSRLDREWHSDDIDLGASRLHQLIVELDAPLIYTTNYDNWIERAYDRAGHPYDRIVTVGDLRKLNNGATQIIKFHGDFSNDESIVLAEDSYFKRLDFEGPLDIRFRADSLGRTILFLGYSLADLDVRYLLYRLQRIWSDVPQQGPDSYIFLTRANPVQETVMKRRGVTPVVSHHTDPLTGMIEFLEGLVVNGHGRTVPATW